MLLPGGGKKKGSQPLAKLNVLFCVPIAVILFVVYVYLGSGGDGETGSAVGSFAERLQKGSSPLSEQPPTRQELGRSAWTMLHKLAATTPLEPDPAHQEYLIDYIYAFINLYPCDECRKHAQVNLAEMPPDDHVGDRDSFVRWACNFHNKVNLQLGKPEFDCEHVDDRWGGCGCEVAGEDVEEGSGGED